MIFTWRGALQSRPDASKQRGGRLSD